MKDFTKKNKWALRLFFSIAILLALIFSFETLISNDLLKGIITDYNYTGVVVASFLTGIAGFPVPIVAFTPLFVELGLDTVLVVVAIVGGLTMGDLVTYAFGIVGRRLSGGTENRVLSRLEVHTKKHKTLPLWALFFWASFVPIPNEVLLLPLGLLGYRFAQILPPLILGNVILNTLVASGIIGIFSALF